MILHDKRNCRVSAVDQDGRNFIKDVGVGQLWYFPAGIPHSIQALEEGCEFLLVFDDGSFSETSTFLVSDWFRFLPKEVLAKNFQVDESAFDNIPNKEVYIYPTEVTGKLQPISDPNGVVPNSFFHDLLGQKPIYCPGGTVRIADSKNFPASTTIAAALVEIKPGGMRELHWHPNADEWTYFLSGCARLTAFASGSNSRTFDYRAGDVGYIPRVYGHYVENLCDEPLIFLELFKSSVFQDISLNQWLALTPPNVVKSNLNLSSRTVEQFKKKKPILV